MAVTAASSALSETAPDVRATLEQINRAAFAVELAATLLATVLLIWIMEKN